MSPRGTPITAASATTAAAGKNVNRAPQITRLSTSRPNSSVPNQWIQLGPLSVSDVIPVGSYGAITGARSATTTTSASTTAAMTAARLPRSTRVRERHRPPNIGAAVGATTGRLAN